MLIPRTEYLTFVAAGKFSKAGIREFAGSVGVAPGVVVGRLQHDGMLPFTHCNELKQHFEWAEQAN